MEVKLFGALLDCTELRISLKNTHVIILLCSMFRSVCVVRGGYMSKGDDAE